MALQMSPKSASSNPEGSKQGLISVTPGKDGRDRSIGWCPGTRASSGRRIEMLLTVAVAVVLVIGTLSVIFAVLQETRLQRQELMLLEMQKRIQNLERQMHLQPGEERKAAGHTPPDLSSKFPQSVTRLPGDQDSLAPQANQTGEAGKYHALSRSKRNNKRKKEDEEKVDEKKKKKEKKEKQEKMEKEGGTQKKEKENKKRNKKNCRRPNCETVERLIDCKLSRLHAATRLSGPEQDGTALDGSTFQWAWPNETYFRHSFTLVRNSQRFVTGIEISQRAVYHIYSQVAMHGKNISLEKLECGHTTVVLRREGNDMKEITLMRSLTSQIASVESGSAIRGILAPIDTVLHVGDHILNEGDIILVKRPDFCGHIKYQPDPHYTYFGVSKLHDLSSSHDCYF